MVLYTIKYIIFHGAVHNINVQTIGGFLYRSSCTKTSLSLRPRSRWMISYKMSQPPIPAHRLLFTFSRLVWNTFESPIESNQTADFKGITWTWKTLKTSEAKTEILVSALITLNRTLLNFDSFIDASAKLKVKLLPLNFLKFASGIKKCCPEDWSKYSLPTKRPAKLVDRLRQAQKLYCINSKTDCCFEIVLTLCT